MSLDIKVSFIIGNAGTKKVCYQSTASLGKITIGNATELTIQLTVETTGEFPELDHSRSF